MYITTLPIAYRPNRPFRILYTQYVASCIARLTGSNLALPLNKLGGLRKTDSNTQMEGLIQAYQENLRIFCDDMPATPYFFADSDPDFVKFVSKTIKESVSTGLCSFSDMSVDYCDCGRVEIPTTHANNLIGEGRPKLISGVDPYLVCAVCKSSIHTSRDSVLVSNPMGKVKDIKILQPLFRRKIEDLYCRMGDKTMLVSRSHRNLNINLTFEGLIMDPDYCWIHYILYLSQKLECNTFCVVVGINQAKHAYFIQALSEAYCPEIKIHFLFTPLIKFSKSENSVSIKTTLDQLTERLGSEKGVRLFLSLLIRWDREVSGIDLSSIQTIKNTLANKVLYPECQEDKKIPLSRALEVFSVDGINALLKKIRQRKVLSQEEYLLYRSL